jgi:nitroreductase
MFAMELGEVIERRRSTRSLAPVAITDAMVRELAHAASLAPSCYNRQPWRFVFVYEETTLDAVKAALNSPGNDWAKKASLIVGVFSEKNLDCIVKEREYFLFDTGMATGMMLLKAVELNLLMHPIAGFDEEKAKKAMGIPAGMRLITLLICGAKADSIDPMLNESQRASEMTRPARKPFEQFVYRNKAGDVPTA